MLNIQSLQSAVVRRDPYPHLIVNNLFEDAQYAALLRSVPNAAQMRQYDPANVSAALTLAELRPFAPDMTDPLDAAIQRIGDIVAAKFTDDILASWSDLFPDISMSDLWPRYQGSQIIDRGTGFTLRPHLDGAECLITILLYLAEDDSHAEHGTQLFGARKRLGFNKHYVSLTREPHELDLELHSTVPYVPNSMMAFVNTPFSFHGNAPMSMPTRKAIQNHIRLFPDTFHRLYKPLGPKLRHLPDVTANELKLGEIWAAA
jgi:hypothetical protein